MGGGGAHQSQEARRILVGKSGQDLGPAHIFCRPNLPKLGFSGCPPEVGRRGARNPRGKSYPSIVSTPTNATVGRPYKCAQRCRARSSQRAIITGGENGNMAPTITTTAATIIIVIIIFLAIRFKLPIYPALFCSRPRQNSPSSSFPRPRPLSLIQRLMCPPSNPRSNHSSAGLHNLEMCGGGGGRQGQLVM